MPHTRLRPTYTFDQDRLDQLRAVVPEAFADGKIDWDTLRDLLGDTVEDPAVEHFGLSWPGKREARRLASRPSRGALVPVPGEGINEETTRNIFIEGENLEVLKLLLKSYAGRVKMIYIDPPYNTGNDFIYSDDFAEPLEAYLRRTGQADEEGLLQSNPKSSGRYHSNWLSMMYPRLALARQFLKRDGLIFVTIDDSELHHLRAIMDEVFGPENFLANIAWEKRYTRSNNAKLFYSLKDSILVYRASTEVTFLREARTEKSDSIYANPDDDPRGPWTSSSYVNPATKEQRPNLVYTIVNPHNGEHIDHPTHAWKYEYDEHVRHKHEDLLWWGQDKNAKYPRLKVFLSESAGLVPIDLWDYKTSGTTDEGGHQVKVLFDEAVFDNPKPTALIRRMIRVSNVTDSNAIVMDFFAGSGSTAQAVAEYNREQNQDCRFIIVQIPEPTPTNSTARRLGYNHIASVSKERIRRAVLRMQAEQEGQLDLSSRSRSEDLGFRVYRLDRSHFKPWTDFNGDDVAALQAQFDAFESPLLDGWQPDDLLVEIMSIEGFPLDSTVTRQSRFTANDVRLVESDFHEHRLWVCLDQRIEPATASALAMGDNDVFICLDSAVDDEMKLRLSDGGNCKTI